MSIKPLGLSPFLTAECFSVLHSRRSPGHELDRQPHQFDSEIILLPPFSCPIPIAIEFAIDVETADHEVADEAHIAGDHLRLRLPNAQIFIVRIGHRAAFVAR